MAWHRTLKSMVVDEQAMQGARALAAFLYGLFPARIPTTRRHYFLPQPFFCDNAVSNNEICNFSQTSQAIVFLLIIIQPIISSSFILHTL